MKPPEASDNTNGFPAELTPIAPIMLQVEIENAGKRLDTFLAEKLSSSYSRQRLQQLIQESCLTVEGVIKRRVSLRLKAGQALCLTPPPLTELGYEAQNLPLPIIYEDDSLLVVDKPVGMLTHPTGFTQRNTLVNALLYHCGDRLSSINGVVRPGIVHRLDRDTSGLMVVAKTDGAHRHLANQLRERTLSRQYWAIVQGVPSVMAGCVDAAIARNPQHRQKMQVDPEGRLARTHWRVEKQLATRFAWIHCKLETGRTHQIRVHMAHIGHPLVGDPLYGSGLEQVWKLETQGQLLQAFSLGFLHPVSEETLHFQIEPHPRMVTFWDELDKRVSV